MNRLDNPLYQEDIEKVFNILSDWSLLRDKTILISGATGMIGTFLVDIIMYCNKNINLNCKIYALSRDENKAIERFNIYKNSSNLSIFTTDINEKIDSMRLGKIDFIIHAASNTHPVAYATDPIGTITTNVLGTYHLLNLAVEHKVKRFIFTSSVEVYGENKGDCELFSEDYCGYIDCNTLRAGYPESKRAGEALCQAYMKQKDLDIVIPRLARTYGPTMLKTDSKAISQFIKKGIANEDIVLKSEGNQWYSYSYVADAVSGILYCLFKGKSGEAYNIADENSNIMLKDLAQIIAEFSKKKVIFELPDETEKLGYSKATKAAMDGKKVQQLGWRSEYDIKIGLQRTLFILKNKNEE